MPAVLPDGLRSVFGLPAADRRLPLDEPDDVEVLMDTRSTSSSRSVRGLRASGIYDACVRKHVLCTLHSLDETERLSFPQRLTFGIGNGLHAWLQDDPTVFGDRRYGVWVCSACGKRTGFRRPPKKPCHSCGARVGAFRYDELSVSDASGVLTGHPDMFIKNRAGRVRLAEFKTIDGDRFDALAGPLVSHVWQVTAYLSMLEGRAHLVGKGFSADLAYIFYFSKKSMVRKHLPVKVYPVRPDPAVRAAVFDRVALYTAGLTGEPPKPLADCTDSGWSIWRARSCPAKAECRRLV